MYIANYSTTSNFIQLENVLESDITRIKDDDEN